MAEFRENATMAIFIGIGAAIASPVVIPVISAATKPILKMAIKGGMFAFIKLKEKSAELKELLEDLAAEAKMEIVNPSEKNLKSGS